MKKLIRYFVRGCLVLAPLAATAYIIYVAFTSIDQVLGLDVPGLGFAITLGLITLVGFLTSSVIGSSVVEMAEGFMARLPLVKLLYSSLKDLIGAFMGQRASFDRPVTVRISEASDIKTLGFVTRGSLAQLGLPGHVAVYMPQSYNVAGNLLLVPADRVEAVDVPTSEIVTFVVSGGISGLGVGYSLPPPPPSNRATSGNVGSN
jgi:uncharacterized membrane protein